MNDYLRPGKMPGGIKLRHCIDELKAIFQRMPVTDRDRATLAFKGMTQLASGMDFYDPSAREPYVDNWYLGDQARDAVKAALIGGELAVWIRLIDETIELDHEDDFSGSRWKSTRTLDEGKYRAENVLNDEHGPRRSKYEGGTLWVREEDWPPAREALIAGRERWAGSVLADDWKTLLSAGPAASEYPIAGSASNDPLERQWSMYEAAAWLATGDATLVEQQSAHLAEYVTTPRLAGAAVWLRLERAIKDYIGESWDLAKGRSAAEIAVERLRAACQHRVVPATAVPITGGARRHVPPVDFDNVELWPGYGGCLHRIVGGRAQPATWFDLRFDAGAVRALTKELSNTLPDSKVPELEPAPPPLPRRRGRRPRYDWPGAMAALNELDGRDDLFRRIIEGEVPQAVAEQFVTQWFDQRGGEPGESSVRQWVRDTLQSRRESNAAKVSK